MPLYEYHCSDCQSAFETLRPMRQADDPIACAHCGSEHTSRVLSVFATIGTGRATTSGASSCGSCSGGDCAHCGH